MDKQDFIQASTTTKIYERDLLNQTYYQRLLDQPDLEGVLNTLADSSYTGFINDLARPEDYEEILSKELRRVYKLMEEISPDKDLVKLVELKYLYHNLKVLTKETIQGEDYSGLFIDLGGLDIQALRLRLKQEYTREGGKLVKKSAETNSFDEYFKKNFASGDLETPYRDVLEEALSGYMKTSDPQFIDISLDKAYYRDLLALSKDYDFIEDFLRERIDLLNIKTLLRCKYQERDPEFLSTCLLDGGYLEKSYLESLSIKTITKETFRSSKVSSYLEGPLSFDDPSKRLLELEKSIDRHLVDRVKDFKKVTYGPEVLLGFLIGKEIEIKNLRIILVSKVNGISSDLTKERLRESYV